jgi:UDP-2,4-diacetamido-2,4,6-trideoxy-beta-L-altropyranose hydrolase
MSHSPTSRLLFRADGNATIGLGHLVRLLALADQLRGLATSIFLVRAPTAAVMQLLNAEGWAVQSLPANQPWLAEADWLVQHFLTPADVLLLDGYHFEADYQRRLRASGCGLVYIDDLCAWPVVADVLINHSPGVAATDYKTVAAPVFMLGPAFSLLRQPFLDSATSPQAPALTRSALVCFGGADPLRLTIRILHALLALPHLQRLGVLLGGAFGDTVALEQLVTHAQGPLITIYRNVDAGTLVELLQDHDLAVVPASTVLIEALVLGRPVLTGYYADNQRRLATYVYTHQQAFSVGNFADLSDTELLLALREGMQWAATTNRRAYAEQLHPARLRAEVRCLLSQHR